MSLMALMDRNIDIKNIVCFGVLTPQTWFKMNEVAFLGLVIWKRRIAANFLMPDLNSTSTGTPRYEFSELWGFQYKFMDLSTSSFTPRRVFDGDPPPPSFRSHLLKISGFSYLIIVNHHTLVKILRIDNSVRNYRASNGLLGRRNIEREVQETTSGFQVRLASVGPLVGSRGKALDRVRVTRQRPLVLKKLHLRISKCIISGRFSI